jgi:putative transcriptional regulator
VRRAALWLAVIVWLAPAILVRAEPEETPALPSMTGQLIVAAPGIGDPRFEGAVIYLIHHDKDGAFGVAINRPITPRPFADLLEGLGQSGKGVAGNAHLFAGGPVQPEVGIVLHSSDFRTEHTIEIDKRFSVTSDAKLLRAIAEGKGPKKSLILFGFAGWGPGQLEDEMGHNDWYVTPADATLLFDEDRATVWQSAYDKRTMRL